MILLCKQEGFTKINRSVRSVLENQQNVVMLMNNKVAAISKTMELPGGLILESNFLTLQKQWSNSRVGRL